MSRSTTQRNTTFMMSHHHDKTPTVIYYLRSQKKTYPILLVICLVTFLSYFISHVMSAPALKRLNILAMGDSLTEGYYNSGMAFHPYANHLKSLFESANIPVNIDQKGISGELVVPTMNLRLQNLLKKNASYDWILILGGTNDLGHGFPPDHIFSQGLKSMYDLSLSHMGGKAKLAAMTVIENGFNSPKNKDDNKRQALNTMIRKYVEQAQDQSRICLVDLDQGIPFHSIKDPAERRRMWDDSIHLTPAGYDVMATLIFNAIKDKL